jgi:hypothetical protein
MPVEERRRTRRFENNEVRGSEVGAMPSGDVCETQDLQPAKGKGIFELELVDDVGASYCTGAGLRGNFLQRTTAGFPVVNLPNLLLISRVA